MPDDTRRIRAAERRGRAVLRRVALDAIEQDLTPVAGAEAISLVTQLTRENWSLSGRPWPVYSRSETPYRFVASEQS